MRIAYLINQYPAVSHTFIRREIRALESLGVVVARFAVRPGASLVDSEDKAEAKRTRYITRVEPLELICSLGAALRSPRTAVAVLAEAVRMGWKSERSVVRHLAYVVEAAVLARWCKQEGIDHVHAHFGTNSAAIAMFASQLSHLTYSFTAHGPEEFEKGARLSLDLKLRHSAFAICVSSFGRSQLMRLSRPDQWSKIAVVHCGLDSETLGSKALTPPSSARFVCVGRLCQEKAQLVLVAAAKKLHQTGHFVDIVLVGDGPMRATIEAAIEEAGLENSVKVTGWVDGSRVRSELAAARALVLPSFSENLPVVIMEAMATSRPVISTYVAGIPEIVHPGKTGWLVPAGDADALARAMSEAVKAPEDTLRCMGFAGRSFVLAEHDALKEAKKIIALMERHSSKAQICSP